MESRPRGYLLLHNVSKRHNIGNIVRSACAFGLEKVLFVSNRPQSKKVKLLKEFHLFGNQGTSQNIEFQAYASLQECKEDLRNKGVTVCGVQIGEGSVAIQKQPFRGDTAFLLGNEGTGILPCHRQLCDYFVYIPQYTEKTASLNVSVAAGIIFHHFAMWAGYQEAQAYGEKYQLQLNEEKLKKEKAPSEEELEAEQEKQEGQQGQNPSEEKAEPMGAEVEVGVQFQQFEEEKE